MEIEENESKEQVLKDIRDLILEAKQYKNGEFRTQRALFEQQTKNDLKTIKQLVESYSNVIQSSVWFFKFINYLRINKKMLILFILGLIVVINLIQYIPIQHVWDLFVKWAFKI